MIKLLRALAFAAVTASIVVTPAHAGPKVVELFTSQGCSSCPAADAVLADLAMRDDVLPLAFHVDYWNYLGWADTFSAPQWTARQRAYNDEMGEGVYTPQIVVDGRMQGIGSRREAVEAMIADAPAHSVDLDVKQGADHLTIRMNGAEGTDGATLHLVWFDRSRTVPVERGENAGATLRYANVVRDMRMLAMADGGTLSIDLPLAELSDKGHEACALILQAKGRNGPGAILASHVIGDVAPDLN